MVCAFFGHRDYPFSIKPILEEEIEKLILVADVDTFFVGNKGMFDRTTHIALKC